MTRLLILRSGLAALALCPAFVLAAAPPPARLADPTKRLPSRVDNSVRKFFPPILQQRGGSCAQVTAIQNVFAYEINRLRDRDSRQEKNQYPAHFTWLSLNNAQGKGSSSMGGWNIAREIGVPTLDVYGGRYHLTSGAGWMSGYDKYFQAMHNRVESSGSLRLRSVEDLEKIKAYLVHRDDPSQEVGGLLYFGMKAKGRKSVKIAKGLPEAGKTLFTSWGKDGGHAMTLVGYDDNVGHDVNGDGKITNDKDIDGDGKVGLADMERGAFIFADSKGTRFAESGKAYVLYRVWAMKDGGAGRGMSWVKAKKDYQPSITLKLKFAFGDRSALRLSAGAARAVDAAAPTTRFQPALFNGRLRVGEVPMRGKDNHEPIEVGLDVSQFASVLEGGKQGKFFLTLDRRSNSKATGQLLQASVLFYEGGKLVREVPFPVKEAAAFGDKPLTLSVLTTTRTARR